jgi:hypothetical protein
MKKILTIALLLFSIASYAQGNLQFNQVKTFTGNSFGSIVLDTVPNGKIWKIESMGFSKSNNCMTINGTQYLNFSDPYFYGNSFNNSQAIKETLWLKSGDVLGWSGYNSYVITLIEYNIIP